MNQDLRFGVVTLQNLPWKQMVECWQQVESMDFDSLWLADHFVNYMAPTAPWFEAWTLLSAMATRTKRVRIGTLVTAIAWRNPAMLARQALTVDHISNGRLELGLGAGESAAIDPGYAMTGTPDWPTAERVGRFREVVEIVDQLLRNRVSSYQGEYFQLQDTAMSPAPIQAPRPPITIGALGPVMLKLVARYADTWNSFGGHMQSAEETLAATRQRNHLLDQYCAEIDRDPKTLRRSFLVFGPPADQCYGTGSLEAFYEVIGSYQEAGISEFIFYYPFMEEHVPAFERIAGEGIPKLRGKSVHPLKKIQNAFHSLSPSRRKMPKDQGIEILSGGPQFEGPFTSANELDPQGGICVILALTDKVRKRYRLLDVCEAEDIRSRMQNHERQAQWQQNAHGELCFAVYYATAAERKDLIKKILGKFSPVCFAD